MNLNYLGNSYFFNNKTMQVVLIQAPLIWENPEFNRKYFESKINLISSDVNLVVLPEMFTTGFTMNPIPVAETMKGETLMWLKAMAKARKTAITGSVIIKEDGKYFNRMLFAFPSGAIQYYDKRHLFTLAGEDEHYTAGNNKLIVEYLGWKICLLICYDLRFPVFSRNKNDYDLLLYVANWPKTRTHAWDALLKARAIENMSYVIGVNRTGEDQNGHSYIGHSQVVDCMGDYLVAPEEVEAVFKTTLDHTILLKMRDKFGFLKDQDFFKIKN